MVGPGMGMLVATMALLPCEEVEVHTIEYQSVVHWYDWDKKDEEPTLSVSEYRQLWNRKIDNATKEELWFKKGYATSSIKKDSEPEWQGDHWLLVEDASYWKWDSDLKDSVHVPKFRIIRAKELVYTMRDSDTPTPPEQFGKPW